jgi:hypothetical protein
MNSRSYPPSQNDALNNEIESSVLTAGSSAARTADQAINDKARWSFMVVTFIYHHHVKLSRSCQGAVKELSKAGMGLMWTPTTSRRPESRRVQCLSTMVSLLEYLGGLEDDVDDDL